MSGLAPHGRDDQPLVEVRIIGGKPVEVAVDKYGKPLNQAVICHYYMTRTAPRALSLQNYWENPRMRAVRDGASRGLFLKSPENFAGPKSHS